MNQDMRSCTICGRPDARDPDVHMARYGHTPVYQ
jgi:hypothetical protein